MVAFLLALAAENTVADMTHFLDDTAVQKKSLQAYPAHEVGRQLGLIGGNKEFGSKASSQLGVSKSLGVDAGHVSVAQAGPFTPRYSSKPRFPGLNS